MSNDKFWARYHAALKEITPDRFEAFIAAKGFEFEHPEAPGYGFEIWSRRKGGYGQIKVGMHPEYSDYSQFMSYELDTLSDMELVDQLDLFAELTGKCPYCGKGGKDGDH